MSEQANSAAVPHGIPVSCQVNCWLRYITLRTDILIIIRVGTSGRLGRGGNVNIVLRCHGLGGSIDRSIDRNETNGMGWDGWTISGQHSRTSTHHRNAANDDWLDSNFAPNLEPPGGWAGRQARRGSLPPTSTGIALFLVSLPTTLTVNYTKLHYTKVLYSIMSAVAYHHHQDDDEDDDEDDYDSEEEERLLSRMHGEAQDASETLATASAANAANAANASKKRQAPPTDAEIAAEYNSATSGKTKTRRRTLPPLNETQLLQANGLMAVRTQFPEHFHSRSIGRNNNNNSSSSSSRTNQTKQKYARTRHDMARFSRHLRTAYQQWAQQLVVGTSHCHHLALEDVLWKIQTLNSKTSVKHFLQHMRNQIRNEKVERIYGLEKAEQLLAHLNDEEEEGGRMELASANPSSATKDDTPTTTNHDDGGEQGTPSASPPPATDQEQEDMDAATQEAAFDMDPDDFVPTQSSLAKAPASMAAQENDDDDEEEEEEDMDAAMQEAAFESEDTERMLVTGDENDHHHKSPIGKSDPTAKGKRGDEVAAIQMIQTASPLLDKESKVPRNNEDGNNKEEKTSENDPSVSRPSPAKKNILDDEDSLDDDEELEVTIMQTTPNETTTTAFLAPTLTQASEAPTLLASQVTTQQDEPDSMTQTDDSGVRGAGHIGWSFVGDSCEDLVMK